MIIMILSIGFASCQPVFAEKNMEFKPGEDSGFYYTIKKGDTLWDLSQKFYHSQWDWPGLWEMNDDIKNPHWIYPGKKIKIFLKGKLKPVIVPVKKDPVHPIPAKVEASFSFSKMNALGFLKKKQEPSLGTIIKEKDGHLLMSTDDTIYIRPTGKAPLTPGKPYHVYVVKPVRQKTDKQKFQGYKHLIAAQIKVLDHKKTYVTAVITNGYRPVYEGYHIMPYRERNKTLTVEENPAPIDARIICSEDDAVMVNDYAIAFIDAGKNRVKPGQIYTVLRKNLIENTRLWPSPQKETLKLEDLQSGKLIVLHTEDISSTVMILSSGYAIHPNDPVN